MPYVERITRAGKTIEVERYFTSRYKKPGIKRGDKVKPTKEEQKKVNTRAAERKLRLLLNANFGYGDYHLELDYIRKKGQPDRSREQMRKDMDIFLRELRKECKKTGIELKYVHVMEIGKRGARHHHLVINKIDTEILQRCWYKAYEGHNRVKVFPLDDSGNYAKLASYFIKYTDTHRTEADGALQGKRWNCSKRGLYQDIDAGMITKMSWAFTVAEESYDRETHTRTILKIKKVYDVSAVSIPANNDTEISARNFANRSYEQEKQELLKRRAMILKIKTSL